MVIWEAGLLHRNGRVQFRPTFRQWVEGVIAQPGFALAPMTAEVIHLSLECSPNSDIFDVSIVATARDKDLPLMTKDQAIVESEAVQVFW